MTRLPIIVACGGIGPAGRSSGHHAYRRLVIDDLPASQAQAAMGSLAALTGRLRHDGATWVDGTGAAVERDSYLRELAPTLLGQTLIRRLEDNLFEPEAVRHHQRARLGPADAPLQFTIKRRDLPSPLPPGWQLAPASDPTGKQVVVQAGDHLEVLLESHRQLEVRSAGQLPTGFDPAALYNSRNHPRGLQMTVFAASDAIGALGLEWETLRRRVPPEQISVYASSCMGQLDYNGFGGMLQARLMGRKVSSKQAALGYTEMPADFINAYLLGNLGTTGCNVAACATFLYNLKHAVRDIQSGAARVAIVGASEAPLVAEIFDGFNTMGALANDEDLRKLDGIPAERLPDFTRACRPFGENAGFTLAESAQYFVLMDDELALELGACVLGAVNDVFVNADGFKKSITGPGLGNYLSLARAAAATRAVLGEDSLRRRSYVQAHGTGTPQNRVTESHILNETARAFGIAGWPVTAVKAFVGHSVGSAGGDQLMSALGVWAHGIIPGITTVRTLAADVHSSQLDILLRHRAVDPRQLDACLINSKGFGGNNASASILAPHVAEAMLRRRHGAQRCTEAQRANEAVRDNIARYDADLNAGRNRVIYQFGQGVLDSGALDLNDRQVDIHGLPGGASGTVSLPLANPYRDMCD